MAGESSSLLVEIQQIYAAPGHDVDFRTLLSTIHFRNEMSLAELIETDGRLRIAGGRAVTLERYLSAVPDLSERPDALDAAIDVTLRATAGGARASEETVARLTAQFPELTQAIREAATLNVTIWSTTGLRRSVEPAPAKPLPCDFGPLMPDGKPRYELQRLLGQGAFGQVYLALDRQLSEEDHTAYVAIKILAPGKRSPWARQRMIDEATKARRISHPNVVLVLDRGVSSDDEDFIVYEYVDGGDLGDRIGRHRMPIRQAVALVAKIARGVHAAHSAGVIHCDLKPGNIMVNSAGEPKVADFGIAVRLNDHREQPQGGVKIGRGGPIGNLAFVSSEQYRGEDDALSVQSDVYAIGGILYLLLTGELPNGSTLEEIAKTHDAVHGRKEPPQLRRINREVERDLEAICSRALHPKPRERHNSAVAFAEDLEAWLRHEPIRWTKPSFRRVFALWARRKPALAASMFLILILCITGSVVLFKMLVAREVMSQRLRHESGLIQAMSTLRSPEYRFNTDLLATIWGLEWFYGPTVIDSPDAMAALWKGRIESVRRLVEAARAEGRANHAEPLMWETALGFWLVSERNYREAEPILERNHQSWRDKLAPDDHLLVMINALRHCAAVDRLVDSHVDRSAQADELIQLEHDLTVEEQAMAANYRGTPMHLLILQRLSDLYAPALLDNAHQRDKLETERLTILAESSFKSKRDAAAQSE